MSTELRKSQYIYILLILISGLFLSARGYSKINTYEIRESNARLSEESEHVVKGFKDFLSSKYNTLRYMKAYFYAYDTLDLEAFELFATSILLFEPSIDSLLFVVEVPPEQRSNYARLHEAIYGSALPLSMFSKPDFKSDKSDRIYPAHFLKTFSPEPLATGTNLAEYPAIDAAINSVFKTAEPQLVFVDHARIPKKDVYIIDPLFSVGKSQPDIINRINFSDYYADHGFIFLGLKIETFFQQESAFLESIQKNVCLDLSYKDNDQYKNIYTTNLCVVEKGHEPVISNFSVFGVDWSLQFLPQNSYYEEHIWQKYFVLYGGVLFTLILTSYFYMILRQKRHDVQAQQTLSEEIFKKEQLNLRMQDYTDKLELARLQQMDIYRSLQEEKLKAEQANRTKSDFLANMSHELRTPLNSILGVTSIIKDEFVSDPEMMAILESSSNALLEIVNDILDLSKIEAGKVQLEHIDFDMKDVVKNAINALKPIASRKGLYLRCSYKNKNMPLLLGDPLRLSRIFMNLIGNAVKYSITGGINVDVDYEYTDDTTILFKCAINDTGIGINESQIHHIFDKFTQADQTTTRTFGGTGLGLAITQDLLNLMNGRVWVESAEGKGSTFFFELPIEISKDKPALKQEDRRPRASRDMPQIDQNVIEQARLLIVDDNEFNVVLIKKFLNKIGFKDMKFACNGLEAVEAFKQDEFDLILMDCHMPVRSGYEATEDIRALEAIQNKARAIPIIALTADAMVGVKERCLTAGMNDYLTKPLIYADLMAVLKTWLSRV